MSQLFPPGSAPAPKTTVSIGQLPGYVSTSQAPTRRAPWRSIREVSSSDSVTVVLPDELYTIIWDSVEADVSIPKYAKVIMKLEDVLKGDFFTEYIKKGNVLMISEGEAGVDDVFFLREGVLRLELAKESHERAGLQGQPMPSGGRKHIRSRYLVEVNLRLPSMLHGKKGFDRLLWAAQNVLNKSLNWVFLDLNADGDMQHPGPLSAHHPTWQTLMCSNRSPFDIHTPSAMFESLPTSSTFSSEEAQESIYDILEFLDMVALSSPRVQATDHIDSFLSRYSVPDRSERTTSVRTLTWHGLIDSRWVLDLVCSIIKHSRIKKLESLSSLQQWLAITVSSFKSQVTHQLDGYTVLLQSYCEGERPSNLQDDNVVPKNREGMDIEMDEQDHGPSSEEGRPGTILPETQASGDDTQQQLPGKALPKAGFQRFLCAEYTDCLK